MRIPHKPFAPCAARLSLAGCLTCASLSASTCTRAIFKLYDMALYATRKVSAPAELLALGGPKKLHFVALRELSGTDLGLLFIKGLQANSPKELVQKHAISATRLIEIFSGKSKLVPGDTFSMDFLPEKGTQFSSPAKRKARRLAMPNSSTLLTGKI
jgi:Chalcone isomerase-like